MVSFSLLSSCTFLAPFACVLAGAIYINSGVTYIVGTPSSATNVVGESGYNNDEFLSQIAVYI